MANAITYPLESIRSFIIRRTFLVGRLFTQEEYDALKARSLELPIKRVAYLRAFMDGWLAARD